MVHCANKMCKVQVNDYKVASWDMGSYRNKSSRVAVCSIECKSIFETLYRCQKCSNRNDHLINGVSICEGIDYDWIHGISCEQLYTGDYTCDACQESKKISHSTCFYSDDYENETVRYYCYECTNSSKSITDAVEKHHHITNNKSFVRFYEEIIPHHTFCCNNCKSITCVLNGLYIRDEQNICRECNKM